MKKYLLFGILILAFLLRFWSLSKYPESIDEDEMALGYYGYSIVQNGTDEYGNKYPIYFPSVGDYKYGLYSYLASVPVFLFGLNPISTRLISVLAGVLSVFAIYLLSLEIFKDKKYALLAAFVLALSPTHIHYSRVAYNNILGATFAVFSILYFVRILKSGVLKLKSVILCLLFLTLSIFSYQAYRIFLPLVFVFLFVVYFKNLKRKTLWKGIFLTLGAVLIVGLSFISPESRARANNLSTLIEQPKIVEALSEDGYTKISIFMSRVFHNKISTLSSGFLKRYASYFNPKFLFIEVSSGDERHATPDVGLLYLIEAPLFLLGLLALISRVPGKEKYIPLILLFSAPVAASMVLDATSITRSVIFVYGFSLITSLGIYNLLIERRIGRLLLTCVIFLYFVSLTYFIHQYSVHKIYHHPWYGDFGLKEMVESVNRLYPNYSAFVIAEGHYMPFLFYNHPDPKVFIEKSTPRIEGGIAKYDKIYFYMPYKCPLAGKRDVIYACFGYQVPMGSRVVDHIKYRDGQPAITLIEFVGVDKPQEKLPERLEYFKGLDERFPNAILPEDYPSFWPAK